MLKKIPVQQLRLGMHIHEVGGSWLDHPFWRSAFKLADERQLAQLTGSSVREVVIDTDKGLDVAAPIAPPPNVQAMQASAPLPAPVDGADGGAGGGADDVSGDGPAQPDPPPAAPRPSKALSPVATAHPVSLAEEISRASRIVDQARPAMKSMFEDARMGRALDTQHCLPLVDEITQSVSRNPGAIVSLARLKTSDDYTYMHSVAVCALMVALARQMGLGEADTREAGLAGLVHDLGKAMMPLEVLNKPGKLTSAEYAIMKGHPEEGHRMLLEGAGVGDIPLDVCLHHHERVDGQGYPHRRQGDSISLFARMGALCDVYDAITSNRPYKSGWDPAQSVQSMAKWASEGQFDETLFQAFVKSIGIYPTGSLVRLRSQRLGVVVEQGASSLLTPRVHVFHCARTRQALAPELIDLGAAHCDDQIVSREQPTEWGLHGLDDLWRQPQT